jgi:hypothetical protein
VSVEKLQTQIEELKKALEAGGYNAAPGTLTQGSALQMEDLSNIMNVTTFQSQAIKLQKIFKSNQVKSTLVQFNRQLDYGQFGGSAVLEGQVGQEETSNIVRAVVPMAYYVHVRRRTLQSELVSTFDGVKAEDRVDADAAMKIQGDIEFHSFKGHADYSNAGVFDGNPLAMSQEEPGMHGLDPQIRNSDYDISTKDLMFDEYGGDVSVVIPQNGTLAQATVEDVATTSAIHNGQVEKIYLSPQAHGNYNKIAFNKERIVLAGSPQKSTGAALNEQSTVAGAITVESSLFLQPKQKPAKPRANAPAAPSMGAPAITSAAGTSFLAAEVYKYSATAVNVIGEGQESAAVTATIVANGDSVSIAITPTGGIAALFYNIYRSEAGGSKRQYIGRVKANGAAAVTFVDLNNKLPGMATAFALDMRGMEMGELSSFKSIELAKTDLSTPKAYYRFTALTVKLPRFNVLIDNVK